MTMEAAVAFAAAVEAIYVAATLLEAWPAALQAIADATGDVGANFAYRRDDGSVGAVVSPGLEAAGRDYPAWQHLDIRFARFAERGYLLRSDAFTDRHIVSGEETETHPFYVGFLAPHGLKWVMATSISPDPTVAAVVAVQRASGKPPFSDTELRLLSRLGRHVETALRLNIRLAGLEAANATLADAFSRADVGVFVVDALGQAAPANRAASALSGGAIGLAGGRLLARDPADQPPVDAAVAAAISTDGDGRSAAPLLLRDRDGGGFLVIDVFPFRTPSAHLFERLLVEARALVLVRRLGPGEPPDPAALRDLFDLTLGEARVAALVGSGLPPREAAARLGISEETARTVLKRVFAKTGVSRQSQLTSLLSRLALPPGPAG